MGSAKQNAVSVDLAECTDCIFAGRDALSKYVCCTAVAKPRLEIRSYYSERVLFLVEKALNSILEPPPRHRCKEKVQK